MADDTRDKEKSNESSGTKIGGGDVPKTKLPKGMIMGKDGKPYVPSSVFEKERWEELMRI